MRLAQDVNDVERIEEVVRKGQWLTIYSHHTLPLWQKAMKASRPRSPPGKRSGIILNDWMGSLNNTLARLGPVQMRAKCGPRRAVKLLTESPQAVHNLDIVNLLDQKLKINARQGEEGGRASKTPQYQSRTFD